MNLQWPNLNWQVQHGKLFYRDKHNLAITT
ncbi:MAG: hypothetical protein ACI81S_001803 [Sphingobacteriales bacterium]